MQHFQSRIAATTGCSQASTCTKANKRTVQRPRLVLPAAGNKQKICDPFPRKSAFLRCQGDIELVWTGVDAGSSSFSADTVGCAHFALHQRWNPATSQSGATTGCLQASTASTCTMASKRTVQRPPPDFSSPLQSASKRSEVPSLEGLRCLPSIVLVCIAPPAEAGVALCSDWNPALLSTRLLAPAAVNKQKVSDPFLKGLRLHRSTLVRVL